MRALRLDHGVMHWRQDGDPNGVPVVFANSLGTDLRLWDLMLPHMPQGLRLIRFDMRGHGLSCCPPPPYALEELAADAAALLEDLGVRDCVFVGTSIGGMVAQMLGAQRPDLVQSLVLISTAVKMGQPAVWQVRIAAVKSGGLAAISEAVLERWFSPSFLAGPEVAMWRNMLITTQKDGYIGCCQAIAGADLSEPTAGLRQPTLVVAGSLDKASPPNLVRATADLIPQARYHLIEGVGHLPSVEAPQLLAELITEFIQEVAHD